MLRGQSGLYGLPMNYQRITRSGPKIPAAGYLEEERFLDLKNLSFGLMAFKMALKVHNGKWIGTSSEQPNLELGQNLDVQRK